MFTKRLRIADIVCPKISKIRPISKMNMTFMFTTTRLSAQVLLIIYSKISLERKD